MNHSFLSIIQCPRCASGEMILEDENGHSGDNINSGTISCRKCMNKITVNKGILNCLGNDSSEDIKKEIQGSLKMLKRERANVDDKWLLSLPISFQDIHHDLKGHDALSDLRYLVECMEIPPHGIVIDLGAGTCWASGYLSKWGHNVIAVDINSDKYVGLDSAEVYFRNWNVYFERVLMDIKTLSLFKENSVDGIIAVSSIHHSRNINATLREVKRILKPRASFGIVEASCSIFANKKNIILGSEEAREYGWNENVYRISEFKKLFRNAGFALQIFPARSTLIKMDNFFDKKTERKDLKYKLFVFVSPLIWKNKIIRYIFKNFFLEKFYGFVCLLINSEFLGVAKKNA